MKLTMKIFRITTNIISAIVLALVGYIVIMHLIYPDGGMMTTKESWLALAMSCMFFGALLAYWKRITGGILTITSFFAFVLLQGDWVGGYVFYLFLAIGIANLVLGIYSRK